ncbi:MAG: hypothetical protein IJI21_05230 [Clostridia bacterium]|nr:hypothetical protein [Clostridia bacterium]
MKDIMNGQGAGPDVDRLLDSLRTETPDVPADFHASWMKAVRAEAETAGAKAIQSSPAEHARARDAASGAKVMQNDSAASGAKKSVRRKTEQWARLASLAAALIVLIGGTLATRGRWTADRVAVQKAVKSESRAAETGPAALPAKTEIPLAATERPLTQAESDAAATAEEMMMAAAGKAAESEMAFEETAAEEASFDMAAAETAAKNSAGDAAAVNEAPDAVASDTGASPAALRPEPEEPEPEAPNAPVVVEERETAGAAPGFFEDLGQFIAHRWYLPVCAGLLVAGLLRLWRRLAARQGKNG